MARMKSVLWILVVVFAARCCAQNACSAMAISAAGARVQSVVAELRKDNAAEMDNEQFSVVSDHMTQLKETLSSASDAVLACEKPSVDVSNMRTSLIRTVHANGPLPDPTVSISKGDPGYEEEAGLYGHNLRVGVIRPTAVTGLLEVEYSINIECGVDTMLLVYELRDGHWEQRLRWQSSPLTTISDAFGDFFVSAVLVAPSDPGEGGPKWSVAVAHGEPWCSSHMSGFKIDLLAPGNSPSLPVLVWHTQRIYSRGDTEPRIKAFGNVFELRLNSMCLDVLNCYERRAVYRYRLESNGTVRRVGPIATNARGFVEEWLVAPWEESQNLTVVEARTELQQVHDNFDPPAKPNLSEYVKDTYGPVRACAARGVFQVQIDSSLETEVTGKPGGNSKSLPSLYFHVRVGKDGYVMISAPTESDPTCTGPDLMPLNPEGSN